jgi:hypothetical protein
LFAIVAYFLLVLVVGEELIKLAVGVLELEVERVVEIEEGMDRLRLF